MNEVVITKYREEEGYLPDARGTGYWDAMWEGSEEIPAVTLPMSEPITAKKENFLLDAVYRDSVEDLICL